MFIVFAVMKGQMNWCPPRCHPGNPHQGLICNRWIRCECNNPLEKLIAAQRGCAQMEVWGQRSLHISSIWPVDRKASVLMTLHQDHRMKQETKWHPINSETACGWDPFYRMANIQLLWASNVNDGFEINCQFLWDYSD